MSLAYSCLSLADRITLIFTADAMWASLLGSGALGCGGHCGVETSCSSGGAFEAEISH